MYQVSESRPAPCSETMRGVPKKFLVIALSLRFSGLVVERGRRRRAARQVNKESSEPAEDGNHHEQKHEHAGQHALAELRVAVAEADGAGVCGVWKKKERQWDAMTNDE